MSAISMGLSGTALTPPKIRISLIVTGLTDGLAQPGEVLGMRLSNGMKIETQGWGSTPGGSDYGTHPILAVPAIAAGGVIHVTANTRKHQFAALVDVTSPPVVETGLRPGPDAILVETLGPQLEPALTPSAGADAIIVEIDQ